MSETTYNVIAPQHGVPIKAWTKGVVLEDEARKQLINAAQLPFVFNVGVQLGLAQPIDRQLCGIARCTHRILQEAGRRTE